MHDGTFGKYPCVRADAKRRVRWRRKLATRAQRQCDCYVATHSFLLFFFCILRTKKKTSEKKMLYKKIKEVAVSFF